MKFFPHCLFCFMLNRTIRFIFIGFCFKFLSMLMILLFFPVSKRKWKKKGRNERKSGSVLGTASHLWKESETTYHQVFFKFLFIHMILLFPPGFKKKVKKKRRKWNKVGFCFGTASHLLKESETSYHRNFFLTHQEVFFSFWSLMANKKKKWVKTIFSLFFPSSVKKRRKKKRKQNNWSIRGVLMGKGRRRWTQGKLCYHFMCLLLVWIFCSAIVHEWLMKEKDEWKN